MLTRLKVSGFKNLVDVDVRFGPFTCIAGANGVGKSNLFDAIKFLGALADQPLLEAALSVRDEGGDTADVRNLFHRVGDDYANQMSFEAEMIVPSTGLDDLGQETKTNFAFLRYSVTFGYCPEHKLSQKGPLKLLKEELVHINPKEIKKHLLFSYALKWQQSALNGYEHHASPFISSEVDGENRFIKLHHQNGLSQKLLNLPRTVLSVANSRDNPTVLLARREMQSWRVLHLEPSRLRQPAKFIAPTQLGNEGSHLAKALYYLAEINDTDENYQTNPIERRVYRRVANRLSELIDGWHQVRIDRDEKRELLTVQVAQRDGAFHCAWALSEGLLRFLAFTVLEIENEGGVLCIEEPENGIHPKQIEALIRLFGDMVMDPQEPIDFDNPLRQVIINTHSPSVVAAVPDESLLMAELTDTIAHNGEHFKRASFGCLPNTWRTSTSKNAPIVMRGELLAYLNPIVRQASKAEYSPKYAQFQKCRVRERKDLLMIND